MKTIIYSIKKKCLFKVLLVSSLIILSLHSKGQQKDSIDIAKMIPQKFISKVSFFIGPNFSYPSLYINNFGEEHNPLMGFSIGLSATHSIGRFEIEGRSYFNRTKFQIVNNFSYNPISKAINELTNDYIGIGLIPKYIIDHKKHFRIGIGAYFSFLQNSQQNITVIGVNGTNFLGKTNSISYYESIDFGILSSLSYQYPINEYHSIGVEIFNSSGLTNVNINDGNLNGFPIKRNRNFGISINFTLKLKTLKL